VTAYTVAAGICGACVVLDNVSAKIRECYEHAEHCKRLADAESDPAARMDFLRIADGWLVLAISYEFTERLTRFMYKPDVPSDSE
jgi:hypothetical protein